MFTYLLLQTHLKSLDRKTSTGDQHGEDTFLVYVINPMIRPLQTSHNRAGKGSEKEGGKWKMKVPSFARRQNCHNKRPNHLEHAPHVRAWTPSSGGSRVSADCGRLHFVPKSHFL